MLNESKKEIDLLTKQLRDASNTSEQYQNENNAIKNNEIELKEKLIHITEKLIYKIKIKKIY
jgi:hypothetical protein